MTLKPYNANSACIKCGDTNADSQYYQIKQTESQQRAQQWRYYVACCQVIVGGDTKIRRIEHICRYCRNCGWAWPEATLDSENKCTVVTAQEGKPTTVELGVAL